MKMMRIVTMVLVMALAVSAYGAFSDPLEYAEGSELVGQGGWVTNYNSNGSAMPSTIQSGPWQYDGLGWGNGPYTYSGAARDVSGDVAGGKLEVICTFHAQYHPTLGDHFQLTIGDSGITDGGVSNHLTLVHDGRPTVNVVALYMHVNGVYTHAGMATASVNFDPLIDHQIKMTVDLNADTASVYYRDVENAPSFAPIGDGSWTHIADWNASLPMTSITQLGVGVSDYHYWANVEITPEPMTMSLIGLGGLLLARRRR